MSSRSSAAPSGVPLRTAASTSTVEMKVSVSAGSSWPATRGIAMLDAVSSSAASRSPAAIDFHKLDSSRSTTASASLRPGAARSVLAGAALAGALLAGALLAGAALADALLAGALLAGEPRRGLVFLLTASSYGPQPAELGEADRADGAHRGLAGDDGGGRELVGGDGAEQAQRRHGDRGPGPVRPVLDLDRASPDPMTVGQRERVDAL